MTGSIRTIDTSLNEMVTLLSLVDVYGQVAARNLRSTKQEVVDSREFMEGLQKLFREIRNAWEQREIASTVLPKNGKRAAVFLSANKGFYGDIIERTYQHLLEYLEQESVDFVMVVGSEGREMLQQRRPQLEFEYVEMVDTEVELSAVEKIVDQLQAFEQVQFFHGKLTDSIDQEVVATVLESPEAEVLEYIFEPDPTSVVELFESGVLKNIVEQALQEGQLSKFAARIIHLGQAMSRIEKETTKLERTRHRILQQAKNKKQRNRLISVSMLTR